MGKIWIISLVVLILFFTNNPIIAQIETRQEYELIQATQEINPIPLKFQTNQIIQQYITYYQGRGRKTMGIGLARAGRHEKMIRRIFREEGVPEDLFWINQVEKMWGISEKQLWIFLPSIAPKYGLRKNKFIDETRSFEKATRATAQYLKFLFKKYNKNWELVLGAYESGEENIDLAIKKTKVKNYWTIYKYLPRETRNFVPNVLATILIAKNLEKYGFANVEKFPSLSYELLRVPPRTKIGFVSAYTNTLSETIRLLNPELISTTTPPEPYVIRVPLGKGQSLANELRKPTNIP